MASREAGVEACLELLTVEISANENQGVHAQGARRPRSLQLTIEHHVHAVENISARFALDGDDALHAEDVRAATFEQIREPVVELVGIHGTWIRETDGGDFFIVMV